MVRVGNNIRILVRADPAATGWVTKDEFVYDAVDSDVYFEIDGKPVFPLGGHRVTADGFLRSVPIIVFLQELVDCCRRLGSDDESTERVGITSTEYSLEFERRDKTVTLRVQKQSREGMRKLAETQLPLLELRNACKATAELTLTNINAEHPDLKGNPHIRAFSSSIDALNLQIKES